MPGRYTSWPTVISKRERTLVSLSYGHIYKLQPDDETKGNSPLGLYRDGELIAEIYVDMGRPVDFAVSHDLVAVATVEPAGLYICRNTPHSGVIYTKFPMEPVDKQSVSSVTIGNYGANINCIWHADCMGPVYTGMISGKDAFRFDYKPLTYYDDYGRQKVFIRQEYERILAIPHMPRQFGVIAVLSPLGIKFYSLKPYYTINKFTDNLLDAPLIYNTGWSDPTVHGFPSRVQFDCWDMLVQINQNHMVMKYDPLDQIERNKKDWVRINIDGRDVQPNDTLYIVPTEVDRPLKVEAKEILESFEIHADLPVSFRFPGDLPDDSLSHLGIKYLPKGSTTDILMKTMTCITPWALARFVEKFNVKIRAEVWS